MPNLGPTELIIIAVVLVMLFGAKKLPEAARGIGRSLRIFKSETAKLRDDNDDPNAQQVNTTVAPATPQPAPAPAPQLQQAVVLTPEEQDKILRDREQTRVRADAGVQQDKLN
ncbi:Sec-independent protein translocase subunit TatA [Streptosporangium sp. KLBMP 9127]|nr:Sec-independent protein translocase subunit TatA [Streptosporangium sp. KLBMP 9127]